MYFKFVYFKTVVQRAQLRTRGSANRLLIEAWRPQNEHDTPLSLLLWTELSNHWQISSRSFNFSRNILCASEKATEISSTRESLEEGSTSSMLVQTKRWSCSVAQLIRVVYICKPLVSKTRKQTLRLNMTKRTRSVDIMDFDLWLLFSDLPKHAGKKGANSCRLLAVNMNWRKTQPDKSSK